jgi:HD-GYP domain-containing protein (c-di-GMP phosphodiesterase class II)
MAAIADGFDAMASDRPYRQGMEMAAVRKILSAGAGIQWDPGYTEIFLTLLDQGLLSEVRTPRQ